MTNIPTDAHGNRRALTYAERDAKARVLQMSEIMSSSAQKDAWMRLFSKVDAILVGRKVPTSIGDIPAPARTDGKEIEFDSTWIEQNVLQHLRSGDAREGKAAVACLKGINYHEVAHVLFSPSRLNSPYSTALEAECVKRGIYVGKAWLPANILEDQRIESLFAALYTGAKPYFRMSALRGLLVDAHGRPSENEHSFVFSHGRRYLPSSIRRRHRGLAEAAFGTAFVQQWENIVNEYVTLTLLAEDAERAAELTVDATLLLDSLSIQPEHPEGHPGQPGKDGTGPTKSDEKRIREAAEKAADEVEEQKAEDEQSPGLGSDDEDGEDEGDGTGESTGAGEDGDESTEPTTGKSGAESGEQSDDEASAPAESTGDGGDSSEQSGDESDDSPESTTGSTSSTGGGFSDEDTDDDPARLIDEAVKDLLNDEQFSRELDNLLHDFNAEAEKGAIERPRKTRTGTTVHPEPHHVGMIGRLHRVLNQMRADAGASRERGLDHGKVNVMDFVTRKPGELDFFEHYEEGHEDEFDMEVVVLLDMSPSMIGMSGRASLALWQIKSVMQRFDIPVTAYGYNDGNAKCLYASHDVVPASHYEDFGASGYGTDPLDALTRAYNILSRSTAKRRVLFTITDGEWNPGTRVESDAMVAKINGLSGATSIIIGLTWAPGSLLRPDDRSSWHEHRMGREVTNPEQILDVFKEYVYSVGRKAARR